MSLFAKIAAVLLVVAASVYGYQNLSASQAEAVPCCCGPACACESCDCNDKDCGECDCEECDCATCECDGSNCPVDDA